MKFDGMDKLSNFFAEGYVIESVDDMYFSKYDDNTRFVIVEKYPEKIDWKTSEMDGVKTSFITVNINLVKPVQQITLDVTIKKPDITN